ncbi:MAG: adenylate/guanylate cyclase domain-containing protein [Alphaproteobacteria bacterium]|nr:adenylate/guanylate cyclase domain-containing protein [Alphaproteobacteria bacterium]MBU0805944.1 adenylate/guanylate cyclase domain-containing protein [Alphaproteobacteria bacterium]MBU0874087.1 adenylate/guanylate cyclase domain-containing protein [Alphaproteobacteria bacterium]MBU1402089.1 adenylate/guanylate cyclase domain-containing protein [Alphaproteobacteria bacterium]MBU1590734.1 adenylate/guanylate cyclase domain-containing protein [Alphaproteobacteria bacterium]
MTDRTLVTGINEWLVDQALSEPDIVKMFEGLCNRIHAIGIPLGRARLTWPTLHPLFQAETILWRRGSDTEFEQFMHQESQSDAWLLSPMRYMFENDVLVLRRNLDGPSKLLDFPVLEEVAAQGMTDYFVVITPLSVRNETGIKGQMGIISTFSADRAGGFNNEELEALQKIQRRFAVACKTVIQSRIARNISETYLGREAGSRVLAGSIRRGDGRETKAVVWYNDMRASTALADTMPGADYIQLLNTYFDCTATPIIDAGGEVLDFIGDAVLAIFPYQDATEQKAAVKAATTALQNVIKARDALNAERAEQGLFPIRFGIGLNTGTVMFGNIGVSQRLTFSVIGPTVNEVSRIEAMTKATGIDALVTRDIVALDPGKWVSIGNQRLPGVSEEIELFTFAKEPAAIAAGMDRIEIKPTVKN